YQHRGNGEQFLLRLAPRMAECGEQISGRERAGVHFRLAACPWTTIRLAIVAWPVLVIVYELPDTVDHSHVGLAGLHPEDTLPNWSRLHLRATIVLNRQSGSGEDAS